MDIDPHELFEQLFGAQMGGRSRRPRGPRPGQDLQLRMKLSFLEAVSGKGLGFVKINYYICVISLDVIFSVEHGVLVHG